jgi:copper chaperone CopZ
MIRSGSSEPGGQGSLLVGGGGAEMTYSTCYPKGFNDFYKSKAEKVPSWMSMSVGSESVGDEEEENLLDDAFESYMTRTLNVTSTYSLGRRVFVQRNSGRSSRTRSGRSGEVGGKGRVGLGVVKLDQSSSSPSPKGFNEFFYKSEAEKPSWMAVGPERRCDPEENLLDDAFASYISRTFGIDSSHSRSCSQESSSQDSEYNDLKLETEVVLRVAMCCGKCENKVKSLTQLEGVTSVLCDRKTEKVTVTGTARPRDILKSCRKLFEQAEMWSPDSLDDLPQW